MKGVSYQETCKDVVYNHGRELKNPSHPNYKGHKLNLKYLVEKGVAFKTDEGETLCSNDVVKEFIKNNYKTKSEKIEESRIRREWILVTLTIVSLCFSITAFYRS